MENKYKKNSLVKFRTNEPMVHANVMFNYGKVDPNDFKKEEYIGRIKAVIDGGKSYLISTISPMSGFICTANAEDMVCLMDESELDDKQRQVFHYRDEAYEAPNCYEGCPDNDDFKGLENDDKCFEMARRAINSLFPGTEIESMKRDADDDFVLERYIRMLDDNLNLLPGEHRSARKQKKLQEKRDRLKEWFRTVRFKEFYLVNVGIKADKTEEDVQLDRIILEDMRKRFGDDFKWEDNDSLKITKYWLVAVDTYFEEAYVLRDVQERTKFHMWLGPEHYDMDEAGCRFFQECRGM